MLEDLSVEGMAPFTSQLISAMTLILNSGDRISALVKRAGALESQKEQCNSKSQTAVYGKKVER